MCKALRRPTGPIHCLICNGETGVDASLCHEQYLAQAWLCVKKAAGIVWTELLCPVSDGFLGNLDATL